MLVAIEFLEEAIFSLDIACPYQNMGNTLG